jgi:hypothetical protein
VPGQSLLGSPLPGVSASAHASDMLHSIRSATSVWPVGS